MGNIIFSKHSLEQCEERGASKEEVIEAISFGSYEDAKKGRRQYRHNFQFNSVWNGNFYAIKQVSPIVKVEQDEIIVITVFSFYF